MMHDEHDNLAAPPMSRLLVIGLGGGGVQSLGRMVSEAESVPDLVAVHTDTQSLAACPLPQRVRIGERATGGLGTGGDPEKGREAALEDETKLRALVAHTDMVCVVTALGGGTGTGVAPEVLRLAREEGALTLCLATLPFSFEGPSRMQTAKRGLNQVFEWAHTTVVFPNDRLSVDQPEDPPLAEAFLTMDQQVGQAVLALWRLLTRPGLVNLDFADLRILADHGGGSCVLAFAEAQGQDRTLQALERLVEQPMLDRGNSLAQARGLLIGISGGPDLRLSEVETLMTELRTVTPSDATVFFGTDIDPAWEGRVGITVLASEQWREGAATPIDFPGMEVPRTEPGAGVLADNLETSETERRNQAQMEQGRLNLETPGKGRFKDVAPTYFEGQDLDIPTFLRRGIRLLGEA